MSFTVTLNLPKLPGLKPPCLEMRGKTGCEAAHLQSQNQEWSGTRGQPVPQAKLLSQNGW